MVAPWNPYQDQGPMVLSATQTYSKKQSLPGRIYSLNREDRQWVGRKGYNIHSVINGMAQAACVSAMTSWSVTLLSVGFCLEGFT